MELNVVEQRATTANRAWELAKQKAKDFQGKLEEAEVKLVEAANLVFARDKELADLKEITKTCEQVFYNMGFQGAQNSAGTIILQAWKFRFVEGWMAAVNVIGLPNTSPFRNADQFHCLRIHKLRLKLKSNLRMAMRRRKGQKALI